MKAEKEPVLLKELGPVPVALLRAEGGTLAVLFAAGVLGNVVEHQAYHRRQALTGVFAAVTLRILTAQPSTSAVRLTS